MPFRSKELLELWLADFAPSRRPELPPRVVLHDDPTGLDTGIVVVPLARATTSIFCAPRAPGDPLWEITIEAQPYDTTLTSAEMRVLAVELEAAAELCAYLEERSLQHLAALEAARAGSPLDLPRQGAGESHPVVIV